MTKLIKTYKTRANEAIINLRYADVDVTCHFVNGNVRMGKWATLQTMNDIVQRAIENSPLFGKKILLDGEPIPVNENVVSASDITNVQQLREYLVSEYKCDRTKIASPNSLKAKVKELGIELPNMVWS